MSSTTVDWKEVEKRIAGFGVDIYSLDECTFGDLIGAGAAMEVYEGKCKIKSIYRNVAFKRHQRFKIPKLKQRDVNMILDDFQHEIILMKKLNYHTNVVQILGVTFSENKPILMVELGDDTLDRYLSEKVESGNPASWVEKVKLCLDVLNGINGLQDAGIVHGDIKGENVLVFIKDSGIARAKISDFGYSSTLTSAKGSVGGSPNFMAPEAMGMYPELVAWQKNPAQDIFSFGLLTYQVATDGKIPYDDAVDVFVAKDTDRHMANLLANLSDDTPEQFRTIIIDTTKFMPTERASIDIVERKFWDLLSAPSLQQSVNNFNPPTPASKAKLETNTTSIPYDWQAQAKKRLENYAKTIGFDLNKDNINDYNHNGKISPLFWSAIEGDAEITRILLTEYGADVAAKGEKGRTILHYAAMNGHVMIIRLLVNEYGVDPNAKTDYGYGITSIHFAAEFGHIKAVKLLVTEYGVDASAKDGRFENMPVHYAAQNGSVELIKLLVSEYEADANAKNKGGYTPLHYAAIRGNIAAVKLLITEYKVDPNIKNNYRNTPYQYAVQNKHVEIAEFLETKKPFGLMNLLPSLT